MRWRYPCRKPLPRRRIPEIRQDREKKAILEARARNQSQSLKPLNNGSESTHKSYGGYPRYDNPQIRSREADFRKEARKSELDKEWDYILQRILTSYLDEPSSRNAIQIKRDETELSNLDNRLSNPFLESLTPSERRKVISAILDAEFPDQNAANQEKKKGERKLAL